MIREPSRPNKQMTWYELSKYLKRHRHLSVRRARWPTRRYAATFAPSAVLGRQAASALSPVEDRTAGTGGHRRWGRVDQDGNAQALLWRTIAKAVRAVGGLREAGSPWVRQHFKRLGDGLWKGEVEPTRALLQQWQAEQKGHPPLKALTAAIRYLQTQRDWIGNYDQWKQQGYPVGSGIIERAVAVVINRRMRTARDELAAHECHVGRCSAGGLAQ